MPGVLLSSPLLKVSYKVCSREMLKMFSHYCLLYLAVGYLNSLEASVIPLQRLSTQNRSVETEDGDLSEKKEHSTLRDSFFASAHLSHNYVANKAPAPLIDIEEGNYFEGDIILRPEQQLNSVSISYGGNEK
jgi:hypothetical protein